MIRAESYTEYLKDVNDVYITLQASKAKRLMKDKRFICGVVYWKRTKKKPCSKIHSTISKYLDKHGICKFTRDTFRTHVSMLLTGPRHLTAYRMSKMTPLKRDPFRLDKKIHSCNFNYWTVCPSLRSQMFPLTNRNHCYGNRPNEVSNKMIKELAGKQIICVCKHPFFTKIAKQRALYFFPANLKE